MLRNEHNTQIDYVELLRFEKKNTFVFVTRSLICFYCASDGRARYK